jgi:hypothetical protein
MFPFENLSWLGVDSHVVSKDEDILPTSLQLKRMEPRYQFQNSLHFSTWLLKLVLDV